MTNVITKIRTKENIFLAIIIFLKTICFLGIKTTIEPDTVSYSAINGLSMDNIADKIRTPVYPFFLEVCERIGGEYGFLIATIFQFLISCMAVICLYKLLKNLDINCVVLQLAVAFFALSVSTNIWDSILLTESLSVSCVVFYCYLIFKYIKTPNIKSIVWCSILLLIMVFLRPTFIMFLILSAAFLIIYAAVKKPKIQTTVLAMLCMAVVGVIVLGYMAIYQSKHGQFGISSTLLNQQVATLIKSELYVNAQDKEIVHAIQTLKKEQGNKGGSLPELNIATKLAMEFETQQITKFKNQTILSQLPAYLYDRIWTLLKEASTPFGRMPQFNTTLYGIPGLLLNGVSYLAFSVISFGFGIQVALVSLGLFIATWYRKKEINFILLGLWVFIAGIYASAIFGTCGDYVRTAIGAVPIVIIGVAVLANAVYLAIIKTASKNKKNQ